MLEPGSSFGRYRIVRWLARGGGGTVYEAVLPGALGFSKRVALKVFGPGPDTESESRLLSLSREARLGGLLHHVNIVDVLDCGMVDGRHFLAMEYVEGASLAELLEIAGQCGKLLPRACVLEIAIQICRALHHAHEQRDAEGRSLDLVHRDLKPANVMVGADGMVRLIDFGVASARFGRDDLAPARRITGTPRYMSPEQAQADRYLDRRSDLYSLGALLFELITGEHLVSGRSVGQVVRKVANEDPRQQLHRAEARMPGILPILGRCLAPKPGARYPNAEVVAQVLGRLQQRYAAGDRLARLVVGLRGEVERRRDLRAERAAHKAAVLAAPAAPWDGQAALAETASPAATDEPTPVAPVSSSRRTPRSVASAAAILLCGASGFLFTRMVVTLTLMQ
jgi:eukaryotic-like serine/threonine-protein kinase